MNSKNGLTPSLSERGMNFFLCNPAIKDTSNSLLERNAFMMNSKVFDDLKKNYSKYKTVIEVNKERNNYLDPITAFKIKERSPMNYLNQETLNLTRLKYYSRDITALHPNLKQGVFRSYFDYKKDKEKNKEDNAKENNEKEDNKTNDKNQTIDVSSSLPQLRKDSIINRNLICFDKNSKGEIVRRPKGFWDYSLKIKEFNRESKDAPDLFQIISEDKVKKHQLDLINKEETITLLSRNKSWITVTPRSKNRRKPLETIRVKNDEVSPVLPQWMRPKFNHKLVPDIMTKINDVSVRTRKRTMQLVDVDNLTNNPTNRSIFSIGDFRHNMPFKHECEQYQLNVSQKPKNFFDWDDGRVYDNKKKRDYA